MNKKVLVVGLDDFKPGFQILFPNNKNFKYVKRNLIWDKMSYIQRMNYANNFDIIHYFWAKVRLPEIILMKYLKKKLIFHFIGSDVIHITKSFKKLNRQRLYNKLGYKNIAVHQNLIDELNLKNIYSSFVPFVNRNLTDNEKSLPKKFSVIAYVPEGKETFFRLDMIIQAAKILSDINFTIFPNSKTFELPNIISIPFISYEKVINEINKHNTFLRLSKHDGLPNTLLEALSCARNVIWTFNHPYCYKINNSKELIGVLKKLKEKNQLNKMGKKFVLNEYSKAKLQNIYYNLWSSV